MESSMKSRQRSSALILVLFVGRHGLCADPYRHVHAELYRADHDDVANPAEAEIVDQRPLQTAQQFAKMPTASEEKPFAEGALELADKEMDLAFAAAVLDTQEIQASRFLAQRQSESLASAPKAGEAGSPACPARLRQTPGPSLCRQALTLLGKRFFFGGGRHLGELLCSLQWPLVYNFCLAGFATVVMVGPIKFGVDVPVRIST